MKGFSAFDVRPIYKLGVFYACIFITGLWAAPRKCVFASISIVKRNPYAKQATNVIKVYVKGKKQKLVQVGFVHNWICNGLE